MSAASSEALTARRSSSGLRVASSAMAIRGPMPVTVCTCSNTVRSSPLVKP